jgi:hypothetical protein
MTMKRSQPTNERGMEKQGGGLLQCNAENKHTLTKIAVNLATVIDTTRYCSYRIQSSFSIEKITR